MEFRQLGCTGLVVSRLSFGTATLADFTPPVGGDLLVKALELWCNYANRCTSPFNPRLIILQAAT
jgi:aryl-alcohol dehydrogenase-like predicted oxidoreductase